MVTVPSLEGKLYLSDPQSVIAYQLRRYSRTHADTIPILSDLIISLPLQIAKYGSEPDDLTSNIQSDLQGVFNRIFAGERNITVNVTHEKISATAFNVSVSVIYTVLSGELQQTGTTISLVNGRLTIPEDRIAWMESKV